MASSHGAGKVDGSKSGRADLAQFCAEVWCVQRIWERDEPGAMSDSDTDTDTAYGESWYAATMVDKARRLPLRVDLDVDVCVIGGGLAGLTTARELARSGRSVVVLEARRIAASASGRNTGFVVPGFGADAQSLIGRIGFERTKSLWALAQAGLDYVRDAVNSERMVGNRSPSRLAVRLQSR